jgi:hypothetical protein
MNDDVAFARLGAHKFERHVDAEFEAARSRALARGETSFRLSYFSWQICVDSGLIAIHKREACLRHAARKHFGAHKPSSWCPDLPVTVAEREKLENDEDVRFQLVNCFEMSLRCLGYDYLTHPPFHPYVCGILARPDAPDHLRTNPQLLQEFSPQLLEGLDQAFCWNSLESITQRLQVLDRNREYWRSLGSSDDVEEADKLIAELSACYPSKFAPDPRAF